MDKLENVKQHLGINRSKTKVLISIGIIILLTAVFYGFKSKGVVKGQKVNEVQPTVDVLMVQPADMIKNILLTGQTVPVSQVDIVAKYTGKITKINVDLGQSVVQGQELIIQDMSDVTISLAQNTASLRQADADAIESNANFEANYQKAQADYQHSMTNYQRYQTLYNEGAISKEALDNAEQQVTAARASLDTWSKQMTSGSAASVISKRALSDKAQSAVNALQNQKNDLILRAPRNGVIAFRQAEVGAMAQGGQKLLTIIDNSNIYIDCSVSEQDVGQIILGMATTISIDSLGKSYAGKIIYISPAMDTKTQNFTIRVALDQSDPIIKAGMFARTNIAIMVRAQTLFVPKEAIISINGTDRIFIVDGNGQVAERSVKLGLRNDKSVEITSGLHSGEQVAITNLARLKTGLTIVPTVITQ